jgi:hypothetical protein
MFRDMVFICNSKRFGEILDLCSKSKYSKVVGLSLKVKYCHQEMGHHKNLYFDFLMFVTDIGFASSIF